MAYEPSPERMLKFIEMHSVLASARAVEQARERLRFLEMDIAFREEMDRQSASLCQAMEPEKEATSLRRVIDRFREEATEQALAEADAHLATIEAADAALEAAMRGANTGNLESSLAQNRYLASPTAVVAAESKLLQMKADAALRVARIKPHPEVIMAAMEANRDHASAVAWKATQERLLSIQSSDEALHDATRRDVPYLKGALSSHSATGSPPVVARAEVVLAEWEADAALQRLYLEVDAASPDTPAKLVNAIHEHYPPARAEVVAELDTLRVLSETILRELEADAALERLIASRAFEEADEIRHVLGKHSDYAAVPLVDVAKSKLQVLADADAQILAVMAMIAEAPRKQADEADFEVDVSHLSAGTRARMRREPEPIQTAADVLFQAITDYGPQASRSVRMAAWRQGGSAVCMPPPPDKNDQVAIPKPPVKPAALWRRAAKGATVGMTTIRRAQAAAKAAAAANKMTMEEAGMATVQGAAEHAQGMGAPAVVEASASAAQAEDSASRVVDGAEAPTLQPRSLA